MIQLISVSEYELELKNKKVSSANNLARDCNLSGISFINIRNKKWPQN